MKWELSKRVHTWSLFVYIRLLYPTTNPHTTFNATLFHWLHMWGTQCLFTPNLVVKWVCFILCFIFYIAFTTCEIPLCVLKFDTHGTCYWGRVMVYDYTNYSSTLYVLCSMTSFEMIVLIAFHIVIIVIIHMINQEASMHSNSHRGVIS